MLIFHQRTELQNLIVACNKSLSVDRRLLQSIKIVNQGCFAKDKNESSSSANGKKYEPLRFVFLAFFVFGRDLNELAVGS